MSEADQSVAVQSEAEEGSSESEEDQDPWKVFRDPEANKSWNAKLKEKLLGKKKKKEKQKDSKIYTPEDGPLKFLSPSNIRRYHQQAKRQLEGTEQPPSAKRVDERPTPKKVQPIAGTSKAQPVPKIYTPEDGPLKFLSPSNIRRYHQQAKRQLEGTEQPPSAKRLDERPTPKKVQPIAGPSRPLTRAHKVAVACKTSESFEVKSYKSAVDFI